MMFLWIPALLLLGFFVLRPAIGQGCGWTHAYTTASASGDPETILRERLARGEITPEQFEHIRRTLGR